MQYANGTLEQELEKVDIQEIRELLDEDSINASHQSITGIGMAYPLTL